MNQFLQYGHEKYGQYNMVMVYLKSKLTVHSPFLKIPTDGDKTTLLDRLFQASTTLLLKKYVRASLQQKCSASFKLLP